MERDGATKAAKKRSRNEIFFYCEQKEVCFIGEDKMRSFELLIALKVAI